MVLQLVYRRTFKIDRNWSHYSLYSSTHLSTKDHNLIGGRLFNIYLMYEKGIKICGANYIPISLTMFVCKVTEDREIIRHCDRHHILIDAQHGFLKHISCETHLAITLQQRPVRCHHNILFLASDKVPRLRLLHTSHYDTGDTRMHDSRTSFMAESSDWT